MSVSQLTFGLLASLVLTLSAIPQVDVSERKLGDPWFEPFKYWIQGSTVEGELDRLIVKENRTKPDPKLIELAFVRLKSTSARPGYPVVYQAEHAYRYSERRE